MCLVNLDAGLTEPLGMLSSRNTSPPVFGVYWRTLKTLRPMCDPVERVPPHGAWLWRLRNTADD